MKKELDLVGLCRSNLAYENELTRGKIYPVHLCEKVANKINFSENFLGGTAG